jgi:hypothetical protein
MVLEITFENGASTWKLVWLVVHLKQKLGDFERKTVHFYSISTEKKTMKIENKLIIQHIQFDRYAK